VAVATIQGAVLEDEEVVLKYIQDNLPDYTWGSLRTAVLAAPPNNRVSDTKRLRRTAARAGNTGGLFLVLYAIDDKNRPIPYDEIQKYVIKYINNVI
jgi:hypothetical protein